jgi:N4-(beta-N-acetylglucosaminyl)-L-asparaginase
LISDAHTSALDAVEIGCTTCEREQCDGTVGYGGSPDENCETTLDAMVMDGDTMNTGAVAGLRRVRDAISVARHVLDYTAHSLLAGDLATRFATENGFQEEELTTPASELLCSQWRTQAHCQPNYRLNVEPDPSRGCGPYTPLSPPNGPDTGTTAARRDINFPLVPPAYPRPRSHDTISMVAIHTSGSMAAGTSTNGASHKVPGRVGDGPIVGSGSYVDSEVGGCGATGDGSSSERERETDRDGDVRVSRCVTRLT